jgi:hypothetical protein
LTNLVIFKFHLNFIKFCNHSTLRSSSWSENEISDIYLYFMYMVLQMSHEHEYNFSNNITLWLHTLAVHVGRIRKNCLERYKVIKYSK